MSISRIQDKAYRLKLVLDVAQLAGDVVNVEDVVLVHLNGATCRAQNEVDEFDHSLRLMLLEGL